jgi:hypothetical protein
LLAQSAQEAAKIPLRLFERIQYALRQRTAALAKTSAWQTLG